MNCETEDESHRVGSVHGFQYCPYCRNTVKHEQIPVGAVKIGGEIHHTKYNTKTICPEHGELF